jgi:hypothetical protein
MVAFPPPPLLVDSGVFDKLHAPLTAAHHEAGHACVALALSLEVTGFDLKACRT